MPLASVYDASSNRLSYFPQETRNTTARGSVNFQARLIKKLLMRMSIVISHWSHEPVLSLFDWKHFIYTPLSTCNWPKVSRISVKVGLLLGSVEEHFNINSLITDGAFGGGNNRKSPCFSASATSSLLIVT